MKEYYTNHITQIFKKNFIIKEVVYDIMKYIFIRVRLIAKREGMIEKNKFLNFQINIINEKEFYKKESMISNEKKGISNGIIGNNAASKNNSKSSSEIIACKTNLTKSGFVFPISHTGLLNSPYINGNYYGYYNNFEEWIYKNNNFTDKNNMKNKDNSIVVFVDSEILFYFNDIIE